MELLDKEVAPSDRRLRRPWFAPDLPLHPERSHLGLLLWLLDRYTEPGQRFAVPMAGGGTALAIAARQRHVVAWDRDPAWANLLVQQAAHVVAAAGLYAGTATAWRADAAADPWPLDGPVDHALCHLPRPRRGVVEDFTPVWRAARAAVVPGGVLIVTIQEPVHRGERVEAVLPTRVAVEAAGWRPEAVHRRRLGRPRTEAAKPRGVIEATFVFR